MSSRIRVALRGIFGLQRQWRLFPSVYQKQKGVAGNLPSGWGYLGIMMACTGLPYEQGQKRGYEKLGRTPVHLDDNAVTVHLWI